VRALLTDLARSADAARVEIADLRARVDLLESSRHDWEIADLRARVDLLESSRHGVEIADLRDRVDLLESSRHD
jgi:hypothetical protein